MTAALAWSLIITGWVVASAVATPFIGAWLARMHRITPEVEPAP